jgi:hypothetical protein
MSLTLEAKTGSNFKPHPEGIHPCVCVDVIDLGEEFQQYQNQPGRMVRKVRLVFESEALTEEGKRCSIEKTFTASLHPKSRLAEFLSKWRGKPFTEGESFDLDKLIGMSCTLVVSHQQNLVGKTYASIDAVSKPSKKLAPSGDYDPAATRKRIADWKAKQTQQPAPAPRPAAAPQPAQPAPVDTQVDDVPF